MPYSGFMEINGKLVGLGYAFDVLHLVQRKMNFTYTIVPPEQMTIGDKRSGMMKLIYDKVSDHEISELCRSVQKIKLSKTCSKNQ